MLTIGPVNVWIAEEDLEPPANADADPAADWVALAEGLISEAAKVIIDRMKVAWKPAGASMPTRVYSRGQRIAIELGLAGVTASWLAQAIGIAAPKATPGASQGDVDSSRLVLPVGEQGLVASNGRFAMLLRGPSIEYKGKHLQVYLPGAEVLSPIEMMAGSDSPAVQKYTIEGMGAKANGMAFVHPYGVEITTGVKAS